MKVKPVERNGVIIGYLVESPMSGELYCFYTKEAYTIKEAGNNCYWEFNGDYEKPTFKPSMMNTKTKEHFFVTDGKIRYLDIPNLVVDMVDIE